MPSLSRIDLAMITDPASQSRGDSAVASRALSAAIATATANAPTLISDELSCLAGKEVENGANATGLVVFDTRSLCK